MTIALKLIFLNYKMELIPLSLPQRWLKIKWSDVSEAPVSRPHREKCSGGWYGEGGGRKKTI